MKFLHSADWQIGMRFRQFGPFAAELRAVRLRTLRAALELARQHAVDAFLIAGDLFEDHGVDAATVGAVFQIFTEFPEFPIFILPGNHDPARPTGTIWSRPPFSAPPPHLKVFLTSAAVPLAEGWLLANPLKQKSSREDPSAVLAELAARVPAGTLKVGLTHGSPAIESKHQADDFPIHLEAATRAGLDYLGIGHWHGYLALDGGRLIMPGTPEPTDFDSQGGTVCLVELDTPGALPRITRLPVGEFVWRGEELDLTHASADAPTPGWLGAPSPGDPRAAATLLRLTLRGTASPALVASLQQNLRTACAGYRHAEIRDETTPELAPAELAVLQQEHPLLAAVLGDLASLGQAAVGQASGWSMPQLTALAEAVGCSPAELTPELLATARRLLLHEVRTECPVC